MFKKPKNRNFRQRARDSESEEEHREQQQQQDQVQQKLSLTKLSSPEDEDQFDSKINIPDPVPMKKPAEEKHKSKLSFQDDEDEDGDVFKVRKSSYSRRMAKQFKKEQQKLNQRKENEDQTKPQVESKKPISKVKNEPKDEEIAVERTESVRKRMERERLKDEELNVVWVKSESIKKEEPVAIDIPAEDPFSDDSADEDVGPHGHTFRTALQRGVIPDAKTIYALKKQRQQRRDADEFMPLAGQGDGSDEDDQDFRGGRNCAGDDDDDDEDDDGRIDFKGIDKTDRVKEEFYQDEEPGSADEDDELTRWEREQIKKGLGGGQQNQDTLVGELGSGESSKTQKQLEIPAFITQRATKSKLNMDDICNQLRDRLTQSKEELGRLERDLVNIGIETMQSEEETATLTAEAKRCGREFEFYQIVKNHIASKLPGGSDSYF